MERGRNSDIDGDSNKGENGGSVRDSDTECTGTSPHALTEVTKLPHDIVLTMSEGSVKARTTARMITVKTATEM